MNGYDSARLNMVEGQIRPNKVTDPAVLGAFLDIPRELFVPEPMRGIAYVDEDIPLGGGRHLMEPMVFARLLQVIGIGPSERVLEIGAGTGYGTAVLSRLAAEVVAVESESRLAARARDVLGDLRTANVRVIEQPLEEGFAPGAPYDVILFGGAVASIPAAISDQLAEGGRLGAVIRTGEVMGTAILAVKSAGVVSRRALFDAGTPFLPGFEPVPAFVF
jgi:protein-L-isoaspartate(D-aspartate) O-methyltransferase